MRPLRYDLQSSAAKDNSITHAAAARSNLDAAITMRFAASRRKPARIYARTPHDNSHAAIPMRSATGDSKTPYNYAHTSRPKAASSHHFTAAKKQTDRSRNRRTHEVPFIAGCSHFTRKNTRFRAPASSRKQSPCNIMPAITMRFAASTRKLAPIYAQNNTRTLDDNSHAGIPMRSATEIPKHPITTHTQADPKQLQVTISLRQKKKQTDCSRNRRTHEVPFIAGCSRFAGKNTRFRAPASSPKQSHATSCSHSNAICNRKFQTPYNIL